MIRQMLLQTVVTAAISAVVSNAAAAQEAEGRAAGEDAAAPADEIIVTVRRREEKLTDVPSAASVISAQSLADRGGARTAQELLADQPSVRFNNLNSSVTSEISIRASSTARATTGDPSIGLFRNGSYVGGGAVGGRNFSRLDYLDIERVEVLRGTQGALYGRNAVGGAVNIISARPQFEWGGFVNSRYTFENNGFQAQGAVNIPAGESFAVRISGDVVEQDKGFFYNPDNDVYFDREDGFGLRGQVRYRSGPIDVTFLAETQELITPAIHYRVVIPAGGFFPIGYSQPGIQRQSASVWGVRSWVAGCGMRAKGRIPPAALAPRGALSRRQRKKGPILPFKTARLKPARLRPKRARARSRLTPG